MLINKEVFVSDPTLNPIPNLGVSKVVEPTTLDEWAVLRWELEHFVCDGEYERGLERVLSTFLSQLSQPQQPACWVSGFFGSGKSHFVRVLWALWRDVKFSDGATARGLKALPSEITAHLRELTTAGRRAGGLWSAAGTLNTGASTSVRLETLAVLLRSAGLPDRYPLAKFVIWLKREGYYDQVRAQIEDKGRDFEKELTNLYVSPVVAQSLLDVVPDLATSPQAMLAQLLAQYPNVSDISNDDLVRTIEDVLQLRSETAGKLPYTLLVLDELQQFIGQDNDRANHVQQVVELCSQRFGSQLLFVGTGQAALQATPQLSKLQGRFSKRVMLSDTDVQQVTREVVLRKAPDKLDQLKQMLDHARGEIDRHLAGTKLNAVHASIDELAADYPLLPTRRRFWEQVLRAVDASGTVAQLRTQLRIVQETTRDVAALPLGAIVPADAIYEQIKPEMLQSGVLLRESQQIIDEQKTDGKPDGGLRSRICALAFLIGKLPTDGPMATGLRATADALCDLLVDDLASDSAPLRQRVPALLDQLTAAGTLISIDGEYRLQTRESAQWEQDFRVRQNLILNEDTRIAGDRSTEIREAVTSLLKPISLVHGLSKTPRKLSPHFGSDKPEIGVAIPVWIRDEWSVSDKTVRDEASTAGSDSPIVFVFVPRRENDALRHRIATRDAAQETLEARVAQTTPEAQQARLAMQSRLAGEKLQLGVLIAGLLNDARVYQGGGSEAGGTLASAVESAANDSLARLFPGFKPADHGEWGKVVTRARDGNADALASVGYTGDSEKHLACFEILKHVGPTGKKGSEVRRHFATAPFGWPQDAVDGALLVLVGGGFVRATKSGQPVPLKDIAQSQIGVIDFRGEGQPITAAQRIAVRGLAGEFGVPCKPGEELLGSARIVQALIDLAGKVGGSPPLPAPPDKSELNKLQTLDGNGQLLAVYDQREQLRLLRKDWTEIASRQEARLKAWSTLQDLIRYASDLPIASEVGPQVEAIKEQRSLLADPDPVPPISSDVATALRAALQTARKGAVGVLDDELATLAKSAEWQANSASDQKQILAACSLGAIKSLDVGTDSALLKSLTAMSLSDWRSLAEAIPTRATHARAAAAKLVQPTAVTLTLPSATLSSAGEVEKYLGDLRTQILAHIDAGHPVII